MLFQRLIVNKTSIQNQNKKNMKTSKLISVLFLSLFFVSLCGYSSYAIKPALAPAEHIQKVIKESIKYPDDALRSGITGTVDVTFVVNDEGRIVIKNLSSDAKEIEKGVREQLTTLCCKGIKAPYNQYYKVTISFKLV